MRDFHRLKLLPPYVFEPIKKLTVAARAAGNDVVDLSMGNPDLSPPARVVDKLREAADRPRTGRYSTSRGIGGLRRAQAGYYERRFGVKLDPETEVVATLGSKEGFANMAQAIMGPGEIVLTPSPSYPIHAFAFLMAGGRVQHVPCTPDDHFLRAVDEGMRTLTPKPIAVVASFPSNPTAHAASIEFYRDLVRLARQHEVLVLSDLAYAEIYFDEATKPPSILEVPGAQDLAVEFTSMSKTYSMPGWRVGFAVGNPDLLSALSRVKSYLDYGAFTPIQVAAAAALSGADDTIEEVRTIYRKRRDALVESFSRAGWDVPCPDHTMFAWAPIPEPFRALGALEFAKILVREANLAVAPGTGFGADGEGFVRFAFVENEERIRQAARNVRRMFEARGLPVPHQRPQVRPPVAAA